MPCGTSSAVRTRPAMTSRGSHAAWYDLSTVTPGTYVASRPPWRTSGGPVETVTASLQRAGRAADSGRDEFCGASECNGKGYSTLPDPREKDHRRGGARALRVRSPLGLLPSARAVPYAPRRVDPRPDPHGNDRRRGRPAHRRALGAARHRLADGVRVRPDRLVRRRAAVQPPRGR